MSTTIIPFENLQGKIYMIRGQKVMVDRDLAELYDVPTKVLKQAVRRNFDRFPEDFMFQMTNVEFANWRSQFVTSNKDRMGLRYAPLVFTEQGVAMLSGVLNSKRAIAVNINIFRAFIRLRELAIGYHDLRLTIEAMEKQYDEQFQSVFDALHRLISPPESESEPIGFRDPDEK